ncbi:MAG: LamG-like jellyroll fold domain-containing protein [Evtepia sp.]
MAHTSAELIRKPEAAVVQGAWNHVVGTYDGQKVKIYLNGELQNTVSAAGELSEPPHYLFLGGDTTSGGSWNIRLIARSHWRGFTPAP